MENLCEGLPDRADVAAVLYWYTNTCNSSLPARQAHLKGLGMARLVDAVAAMPGKEVEALTANALNMLNAARVSCGMGRLDMKPVSSPAMFVAASTHNRHPELSRLLDPASTEDFAKEFGDEVASLVEKFRSEVHAPGCSNCNKARAMRKYRSLITDVLDSCRHKGR